MKVGKLEGEVVVRYAVLGGDRECCRWCITTTDGMALAHIIARPRNHEIEILRSRALRVQSKSDVVVLTNAGYKG